MSVISLQTPAPDFTLDDFQGQPVSLSNYRGKKNIILVLNRTFQ
jgi:peroxiredoxin